MSCDFTARLTIPAIPISPIEQKLMAIQKRAFLLALVAACTACKDFAEAEALGQEAAEYLAEME